ncbi:MAG: alanine racemase [Bacteroidales bacterium]|nr:alanine racemase [Bacteroidales bacterium]
MKNLALNAGVSFRPHFKTHRNTQIAEIFKQHGITKITVSSLTMAETFANAGFKDITIAFPFNILEIEKLKTTQQISKINLLVESLFTLQFLSKYLEKKTDIFIKIDSGYHRTGINPNNISEIEKLVEICIQSQTLNFIGFLMHAGHTYKAKSKQEILEIHKHSELIAGNLKTKFPEAIVSIGDTPSCSIAKSFNNIDEIRPGNFVYYDIMQLQLGSCKFENIAAIVACPVVAIHQHRNEIVIYGGGVHLSKEQLTINNKPYFGAVCLYNEENRKFQILEHSFLTSLSQEHGIVKMHSQFIEKINPGDIIGIAPVHICMIPLIENSSDFTIQ